MSFRDRFPRRATMLGGPLDGDDRPLPLPASMPWPKHTCHKVAGPWEHYELVQDAGAELTTMVATYRYAGQCSVDNHDGRPLPHEHECCCGRNGCDGSGPWPHAVA